MRKWIERRTRQRGADPVGGGQILPAARADRAERERLLIGREDLVTAIEGLLFATDPVGISSGHNTDEYRPEAQTITLRLSEASTVEELHRIVFEEFVHWFGDPGPQDRYAQIARDIWALVEARSSR